MTHALPELRRNRKSLMTSNPPTADWRGLAGALAAQMVAWTGTSVSAIALPWFVLQATGSPVQTGLIAFIEMAP